MQMRSCRPKFSAQLVPHTNPTMAKPLLLLMIFAVSAIAAEPSPEAMKKAVATYRDVFGAAHDKATKSTKPAEKSEFAKKLSERAKETANDAVLQELLRKYAVSFAQNDAVGVAVAMEIYKAQLVVPEKKTVANEKLAEITEKSLSFEPLANRLKVAQEAVKYYRELGQLQEAGGNATAALASIVKAKALVKKWMPTAKDIVAQLDADEKKYAPLALDSAEIDKLRTAVEKAPADQNLKFQLGATLAANKRWTEAAEVLAALRQDALDDLVKLLKTSPTPVPRSITTIASDFSPRFAVSIVEKPETSIEYRYMGLWVKIASEKSATHNIYCDEKSGIIHKAR